MHVHCAAVARNDLGPESGELDALRVPVHGDLCPLLKGLELRADLEVAPAQQHVVNLEVDVFAVEDEGALDQEEEEAGGRHVEENDLPLWDDDALRAVLVLGVAPAPRGRRRAPPRGPRAPGVDVPVGVRPPGVAARLRVAVPRHRDHDVLDAAVLDPRRGGLAGDEGGGGVGHLAGEAAKGHGDAADGGRVEEPPRDGDVGASGRRPPGGHDGGDLGGKVGRGRHEGGTRIVVRVGRLPGGGVGVARGRGGGHGRGGRAVGDSGEGEARLGGAARHLELADAKGGLAGRALRHCQAEVAVAPGLG
mmetsp:Transcript_12266/g.31686  ORF Transcript_12266/g.31686 Transcript_12266/m.31686 type:complete len:306 (+) Transcript_12266:128-1045(+)